VPSSRWTFTRGDERLELSREETPVHVALTVTGDGRSRVFSFPTLERAIRFQSDMEALLLRTGWSFSDFAPERRTGRERRGFPRLAERRRWWTDSLRLFRRRRDKSAGS
jgi:hypothetical protein